MRSVCFITVSLHANAQVDDAKSAADVAKQADAPKQEVSSNVNPSAPEASDPQPRARSGGGNAGSQDVIRLSATITGNQEQPKVLYIVPWKRTSDNTILGQGLESRLSDVFGHVERSEHQREVEYFEQLIDKKVSAETAAEE